ncbi:MAG: prepilin-type N-terminal cleavage/methylation domain-containing protein, partial [Aestuariibacter sp.]|nr:prepilin-type N-terminal cleavage/methylation domain-containing protein [Aestuariibacter sp.]
MRAQSGFSLVELMISMLLGLMLTVGVIQVLVSTRATNTLNQAIAEVQESGRYISMRLQEELMEAGRYDTTVSSV